MLRLWQAPAPAGGGRQTRTVPLVRVRKRLPQVLSPGGVDALFGALRTARDRAMVFGGLRRCGVLGLRMGDAWVGDRSLFIEQGKGGHQRVVPISHQFFTDVGDYLHDERPGVDDDAVFVVVGGPTARATAVG